MLPPISLFAKMVAMIAPKNHNRIIGIRALLEGIEHATNHGVGIADTCEVAMNRIIPGVE